MTPRVPINALLAAMATRLAADVTTASFFAFPNQNQARPFGEVTGVVVDPNTIKDQFVARVTVSFAVHGKHPTAQDADSIAELAIRSLARAPFDLSATQWQDKEGGRFDGTLRAQKTTDELGEVVWQVLFDVSWILRSTAG